MLYPILNRETKRLEMREANAARPGHLPSLDGLRALSIFLVLLGHLGGTTGFAKVDLGIGDYAHLGVVVFFVISGFLITTLLIAERSATGHISLRHFYARRCLRLLPPATAYMICLALLTGAGLLPLSFRDFAYACTYTVNYDTHAHWQIGHLWSLSVEEQFYLLWPWAFATLAWKTSDRLAIIVVCMAPIARYTAWRFLFGTPYYGLNMFPFVADSLAIGCLLALYQPKLERWKWYLRLFHPAISSLILVCVLTFNRFDYHPLVRIPGNTIISLGVAVLTHRCVYSSRDYVGRLLNCAPLRSLGGLSYSIYIWQQLFLNRNGNWWSNAFPQNLVIAAFFAIASYYLLEQPLMRWRRDLRPNTHPVATVTTTPPTS